jgi:hypothetical protein
VADRSPRDPHHALTRQHPSHVSRIDSAGFANTTGTDNVPQTLVFLHVYHAGPTVRAWARVPTRPSAAGPFVREWTARLTGRERIAVDAIDSQTFNTDSTDDYRANVWAIPSRIE